VDRVGDGVDAGWLGMQAVVHLGTVPGGYAELAVTETARLQEIPDNLDAAEAVAIIGTGRTTMGGETARAAVDLLGKGGQHLVFGWSGKSPGDSAPLMFTGNELAERGITSQLVVGPPMLQRVGGDVRVLEDRALAEAAAGRWRPAVQRFALAGAAEAHRALETRGTVGKVVLIP
jgi:NADPH:quinone reductase-like Zn-dependent oxidoreductase